MVTLECEKCGHVHDEDVKTPKPENSGRVFSQDIKQCPYCKEVKVVPQEHLAKKRMEEAAKRQADFEKAKLLAK